MFAAPLLDDDEGRHYPKGSAAWRAPFHLTHSCYDPVGTLACGRCDSCLIGEKDLRRRGLRIPSHMQ